MIAAILYAIGIVLTLLAVAAARREFRRLRDELRTPLFFETSEGEPRLELGEERPPSPDAAFAASESGAGRNAPSPSEGVYDCETDTHVRAPSGPEVLVYDLLERTKETAQ